MSGWVELVGIIVGSGAAGAGVTEFLNRRKSRSEAKRLDADAAQSLAEAAVVLVAPLQAQIESLTSRVQTLEEEDRRKTTLFGIAVGHIRDLHAWIDKHMPGNDRPLPPAELGL